MPPSRCLTVQKALAQEEPPAFHVPGWDKLAWTAVPGPRASASETPDLRCPPSGRAPWPAPARKHPSHKASPHRLIQWVRFLPAWGAKLHLVNWGTQHTQVRGNEDSGLTPTLTSNPHTPPPTESAHAAPATPLTHTGSPRGSSQPGRADPGSEWCLETRHKSKKEHKQWTHAQHAPAPHPVCSAGIGPLTRSGALIRKAVNQHSEACHWPKVTQRAENG